MQDAEQRAVVVNDVLELRSGSDHGCAREIHSNTIVSIDCIQQLTTHRRIHTGWGRAAILDMCTHEQTRRSVRNVCMERGRRRRRRRLRDGHSGTLTALCGFAELFASGPSLKYPLVRGCMQSYNKNLLARRHVKFSHFARREMLKTRV